MLLLLYVEFKREVVVQRLVEVEVCNLRDIEGSLQPSSVRVPDGEEIRAGSSEGEVAFDRLLRGLGLVEVGVEKQVHVLVRDGRQVGLRCQPGNNSNNLINIGTLE